MRRMPTNTTLSLASLCVWLYACSLLQCGLLLQIPHRTVVITVTLLCLRVLVHCAKTDEPIELPFGADSCGSKERLLHGGPDAAG